MKALVIYDSMYGNTEKVAKAICDVIGSDAKAIKVSEFGPVKLEKLDLLIVGSPTQGGRPTRAIQDFIKQVSKPNVEGVSVAAFDTRFSSRWVNIFGYAAGRITRGLEKLGGITVAPSIGFIVEGTKGPLKDGELERAAGWAKEIVDSGLTK